MPAINISISWHHIYRFYLTTRLMLKDRAIGRLDHPRRVVSHISPLSVIFTFGVNPTLSLPCLAKSRERKPMPSSKCPSITYRQQTTLISILQIQNSFLLIYAKKYGIYRHV